MYVMDLVRSRSLLDQVLCLLVLRRVGGNELVLLLLRCVNDIDRWGILVTWAGLTCGWTSASSHQSSKHFCVCLGQRC